MGLITSGVKGAGAVSVEVDGQRVPLTREGIERAQRSTPELGEKIAGAVRTAVDRAIDGEE
jgi:hypothetical protein